MLTTSLDVINSYFSSFFVLFPEPGKEIPPRFQRQKQQQQQKGLPGVINPGPAHNKGYFYMNEKIQNILNA